MEPRIRFAANGDIDLAYTTIGDGPVDLLFVQGAAFCRARLTVAQVPASVTFPEVLPRNAGMSMRYELLELAG